MNIRDLNNSANRPDRSRNNAVNGAEKLQTGRIAQGGSEMQNQPAKDLVELSDKARAALAEGRLNQFVEAELARKELLGIPPLSEERAADILKRVSEGYFSQPDLIAKMAEQTADMLFGAAPSRPAEPK